MEGKYRWENKVQAIVVFSLLAGLFLYLMIYSDWKWRLLIFLYFLPVVFFSKGTPKKITILDGVLYLNKASAGEKKYDLKKDTESIQTYYTRLERGPYTVRGFEEMKITFKDGSDLTFSQNEYANYFELKNLIYKERYYNVH
jgi:hypothetical protein